MIKMYGLQGCTCIKGNVDTVHLMLDLGTSHFRAAIAGRKHTIQEPCVVAHTNKNTALIGTSAKRMIGRSSERVRVVYPIQDGVIVDLEAAVVIMKSCIEQLSPRRFGRKVSLTIAVPSHLTHIQTRSLQEAGRLAGAQRVELVPAAVAAGIGAGLPMQIPVGCLVVHLGGGVTQAAVLSMGQVVESSRVTAGGRAMDAAIAERVRREYFFLIGEQTAENIKCELASQPSLKGIDVRGRNLRTGLPGTVCIRREVVDELLCAYATTVIDLIARTISTCEPELAGDISAHGIVLTGGLARMEPLVAGITRQVGVPTRVANNPETCVLQGLLHTSLPGARRSITALPDLASLAQQATVGVQQFMGRKREQEELER